MQQEIDALKGVLTQAQQQQQHRQQLEQHNRVQDASQAAVQFRNEVDESGSPLYPHFDSLWRSMMPHIAEMNADASTSTLSHQEKLQAAYDRAVWANPDTRRALQETERQKVADEIERQRSRSAITPRPRSGGGGSQQQPNRLRTLDEILKGAFTKHGV
jgi:outer membrane protein TolC